MSIARSDAWRSTPLGVRQLIQRQLLLLTVNHLLICEFPNIPLKAHIEATVGDVFLIHRSYTARIKSDWSIIRLQHITAGPNMALLTGCDILVTPQL